MTARKEWQCPECGSEDVCTKVWLDLKTDEIVDWCAAGECWCEVCNKKVALVSPEDE